MPCFVDLRAAARVLWSASVACLSAVGLSAASGSSCTLTLEGQTAHSALACLILAIAAEAVGCAVFADTEAPGYVALRLGFPPPTLLLERLDVLMLRR